MQNFEKLGAFYLGRQVDPVSDELADDLVLYDAKDLTTHAVIIGMTGSGKTGLGVSLIEEAALDRIPVIAIDPKGDLGNLLLAFPALRGEDFEPWIDRREALEAGEDVAKYAETVAETWRAGLAQWGQDAARVARFAAAAERTIYTPGSTAGRQLSVLARLAPPVGSANSDPELYREIVDATAASLLSLVGIEADPLTSREHIYLALVIEQCWREGNALGLAELITALQSPGIERVGVVDLDTFYPADDRFALAMRFNNLLAAPRFASWLQGERIDIDTLLHDERGGPRISILSIAHLDDNERMFFVSLVLGQLIGWMRGQSGSSSLRAILYMDEVFGFMPPVAEPPSKRLLLTLMKQARAYGLGVVLATQNPVDLDYKGLSNAGTWLLGRLQTERDKQRVSDGLRSAAGAASLEGVDLDDLLSGLGKRRFLLHNVHETRPVLFETRWAMSYLAGPLTRDQIRRLSGADAARGDSETAVEPGEQRAVSNEAPRRSAAAATRADPSDVEPSATRPAMAGSQNLGAGAGARPVLPPAIEQRFLPAPSGFDRVVYTPCLLGAGELGYANIRLGIDEKRSFMLAAEPDESGRVDWDGAETLELDLDELDQAPVEGAAFIAPPGSLAKRGNYRSWQARLKRSLRASRPLALLKSPELGLTSSPDESERDFRIRLEEAGRERRDAQVAKLRRRYQNKVTRLEERLRRAQQAVERERAQAGGHKLDAALSFGTAVLGALLGRKVASATSASRVGTAVRKAGRARKQAGDVARAEETVEAVRAEMARLESTFNADVERLDERYDVDDDALETIEIKPAATAIHVDFLGIGWRPHAR